MKLEIFVQEEVLSRNKMDVCSIKGTNFFGVKLIILSFYQLVKQVSQVDDFVFQDELGVTTWSSIPKLDYQVQTFSTNGILFLV